MSGHTPLRYDSRGCEECCCYHSHMEPVADGAYVHLSDYDRLRTINAELLAAVEKAASKCRPCGGTGVRASHIEGEPPNKPCLNCADLRALIARAKGE